MTTYSTKLAFKRNSNCDTMTISAQYYSCFQPKSWLKCNIFTYFIYPIKLLLIPFYDIKSIYRSIFSQDYGNGLEVKKCFLFWKLQAYSKSNNIIKYNNKLELKMCSTF